MNFDNNVTLIPGTKRVRYTCIECGNNKEAYAHSNGKKMYCSSKCAAVFRTKKKKIEALKVVKSIEPERDVKIIHMLSRADRCVSYACLATQLVLLYYIFMK
jgi:hypothetical protein